MEHDPTKEPARDPHARQPAPPETAPRVSSHQLLGGAKEVFIEHHGAWYRLRETALGKLILTK
jgi:hemin uptake protein HemP